MIDAKPDNSTQNSQGAAPKTEAKDSNIVATGLKAEIQKTLNKITHIKGKETHTLNDIKSLHDEVTKHEKEILKLSQSGDMKEHQIEMLETEREDLLNRVKEMKNILNELEAVGIKD